MLKKLVKINNKLDSLGLTKKTVNLNKIIIKISGLDHIGFIETKETNKGGCSAYYAAGSFRQIVSFLLKWILIPKLAFSS